MNWEAAGVGIATLALFRPELARVYKAWFKPPVVDIIETEDIEVGFTNFGPIVGLLGTLRAIHRDAFVARMSLKVTRREDSATHAFDWGAFRSMQFTPSDDSLIRCSSFLLTEDYGAPYHVAFIDRDTQSKLRSIIEKLQKEWYDACSSEVGDTKSRDLQEVGQLFAEAQKKLRPEFTKSPFYVDSWGRIGRLFYWEAGLFDLELTVQTSRPDHKHAKRWTFGLTQEDADRLRLNQGMLVGAVVGEAVGSFNFVHTPYPMK